MNEKINDIMKSIAENMHQSHSYNGNNKFEIKDFRPETATGCATAHVVITCEFVVDFPYVKNTNQELAG